MRICLASLHPRVLSGQIDSLAGLGRALTRRGHAVAVVTPFAAGELLHGDLTDLDGGPKKMLPAAFAMLDTVRRVVRAADQADVLHLALPTPAFGFLADLVQAATATPVVVGFEGHLAELRQVLAARTRPRTLTSYLPLWAVNNGLFGRLGTHRGRAYVVSSQFQRDELTALGFPTERVVVLPNVVEDGKLAPCNPPIARRRLGLPAGGPIVGYVGHLNDVKGVDVLASAFATIARARPEATLAVAWSGQGDPEPIRRQLAGTDARVVWLDKVPIGAFLCGIDVLALPYRSTAGQGAYPSLVVEALAVGRPLVTTDLPLLREITALGPVARVCPPERPGLLALEIDRLLASESRRAEMSSAQRRVAREHFAAAVLVPRYEALYASVLGIGTALELAA